MGDIHPPRTSIDRHTIEKEIEHARDLSRTPSASRLSIEKETNDNRSRSPSTAHEIDPEPAVEPKPFGSDAPDGGLAAWMVILGVWCCSFCSYGWMNSIGIFQEYYQEVLLRGLSASTVSWIPSLEVFLMTALGPFVGLIYDRYGPRWLLLTGSVLHVFGLMMASLGTKYYQLLLAQGVCSALGVSMIFQPAFTAAGGWFNKKRGAAFGIAFTGSSLGGIIFPILTTQLVKKVGFPWAMRSCAFLILFLLIIANLTVRPFQAPRPYKITVKQLAKPITEAGFLFMTAGFLCFTFGFYIPVNYLPVQALSTGMSSSLANYLIPILNAGSLFGRLGAGFLSDKLGRYNIFIVVCYLSALWVLALWLPDSSNAALIAFSVLFGFCSGAYVSLIFPMVMQISPFEELGFRTGIVLLVSAIAGLITNPIAGAMVPNNWTGVQIFAGVFCVAGPTLVLVTRIKYAGWKIFVRF